MVLAAATGVAGNGRSSLHEWPGAIVPSTTVRAGDQRADVERLAPVQAACPERERPVPVRRGVQEVETSVVLSRIAA